MDPLGFVDGVNLYGYVGNSCVDTNDPSGLAWSCEDAVDVTKGNVPAVDLGVFVLGTGQKPGTNTTINILHNRYKSPHKILTPVPGFTRSPSKQEKLAKNLHSQVCKLQCSFIRFTCPKYVRTANVVVDIFGWSRGAAVGARLSVLLATEPCKCGPCRWTTYTPWCFGIWKSTNCAYAFVKPRVRFVGLIDAVNTATPNMVWNPIRGVWSALPNTIQVAGDYVVHATSDKWLDLGIFAGDWVEHFRGGAVKHKGFDLTHAQMGFNPDVRKFILDHARQAGAPF